MYSVTTGYVDESLLSEFMLYLEVWCNWKVTCAVLLFIVSLPFFSLEERKQAYDVVHVLRAHVCVYVWVCGGGSPSLPTFETKFLPLEARQTL